MYSLEEIVLNLPNKSWYCIDIGASIGVTSDPAYNFLINPKYSGLCIEPTEKFQKLIQTFSRPEIKKVQTFATPDSIADIFKSQGVPIDADLLKIDIDGYDLEVIRSILNAKYRPKCIVAEINEKIPPPVWFEMKYTKDYFWDRSHCFGFSLQAGASTLEQYGYKVVDLYEGNNVIFLDSKYCDHFKLIERPLIDLYMDGYLSYYYKGDFYWNTDVHHWVSMANDPEELRKEIFTYFTESNVRGKNINPSAFILK